MGRIWTLVSRDGMWQVWSYIWVWDAGCGNKKGWGEEEGGRRYEGRWVAGVARHNTQYCRPAVTCTEGEIQSTARHVSLLSGRGLPSTQPLAQFQTSLAKQLTVGRESLTSITTRSALSAFCSSQTKTTEFYYDGLYCLVSRDKKRVSSFMEIF